MRKKIKKPLIWWILVGLLVLAIILTYFLYQSHKTVIPKQTPVQQVTEDVLKTPLPNASDDEKRKYSELVNKLAQGTSTIDITACQAKPQASKVKINAPLLFKNKDGADHTIIFGEKQTYTIPANSEKQFTINFANGPGIYGFGCDRNPAAAGVLLVTD